MQNGVDDNDLFHIQVLVVLWFEGSLVGLEGV